MNSKVDVISDTNIVCQSVDKYMIKKYLQNFHRMNYIKGPKGLIKRMLFI